MNTTEKMDIFYEFERHLLVDEKPSEYFLTLLGSRILTEMYPFTMLGDLVEVPQSPQHHPEGNVWNHTMMVVDNAAKRKNESEDKRAFMWAALLHDIGKTSTTKVRKSKITSYDHDKVGEILAVKFLKEFIEDEVFVNKVASIVKWHMQPLFVVKNMPYANIKEMNAETSIDEIALLSLCDRLGRGEMTPDKIKTEAEGILDFKQKSKEYIRKQ